MKSRHFACGFSLLVLLLAPFASYATDAVLIPPAARTAVEIEQDQADCRDIATKLTGFDPAAGKAAATSAPPQQAAAPAPAPTGGRVRGAARGAAAGAVVAEADSPDVGRGELEDAYKEERVEDAAKAGAVAGASRQRQQRRQAASQQQATQQQAAQQQAAAQSEAAARFDLATRACLLGRGYHQP